MSMAIMELKIILSLLLQRYRLTWSRYARKQNRLGEPFTMTCPTFDVLLNYVEDTLPAPARAEVADHLAGPCVLCQTAITRLRIMLDALTHDDTIAPPPEVVRRAIAAYYSGNSAAPGSAPRPPVLANLLPADPPGSRTFLHTLRFGVRHHLTLAWLNSWAFLI
jgi:hypothetical protein